MSQSLLGPFTLGHLELKNRVVMAPLTRSRADNSNHEPNALMVEYYQQRASAGLIITEGTWISREAIGYSNVPGLFTDAQTEGWKKVTEAVHAKGGKIFAQLWHVGAISHPDLLDGKLPLAPSAINPRDRAFTQTGFKDSVTPKEMTVEDIHRTIHDYRKAAENAKKAGFDGVEIHGSHNFLVSQFINPSTNERTDEYGGTAEKRGRFLIDVIHAIKEVWDASRIGVKLNPTINLGVLSPTLETIHTYETLIRKLNDEQLGYLHLQNPIESIEGTPVESIRETVKHFRPIYKGTLIAGTGYDQFRGNESLSKGECDLVSFGRLFIPNPDLVERFRTFAPLNEPDFDTFYTGGAKGYTDYASLT